jgi:hypothetical protein
MKTQEYIEFKQSIVTLIKTALRSLRKNKNQGNLQKYETKDEKIKKFRDCFEEKYAESLEYWSNEYVKLKFEDGKISNANFVYYYDYIKDFNQKGIIQLVEIMPMVFGLVSINVKGIELVKNKWALNVINQIVDREHLNKSKEFGEMYQRYGGRCFNSLPAFWHDCFINGEYGSMYEISPKKTHCVTNFYEDLPEWSKHGGIHSIVLSYNEASEEYDYNCDKDEFNIYEKIKKITLLYKYNSHHFSDSDVNHGKYLNEIEIKIGEIK